MIISDENIKTLSGIIDGFEKLLEDEDIEEIMEKLDDLIIDNIVSNNDEPDSTGKMLQKIYDEIYENNFVME